MGGMRTPEENFVAYINKVKYISLVQNHEATFTKNFVLL